MTSKSPKADLPSEPVDRLTGPLGKFLHIEAASGIVLLVFAVTALILANSPWSEGFLASGVSAVIGMLLLKRAISKKAS